DRGADRSARTMRVLALNCGSSSLKHALFDVDVGGEREVSRGSCEPTGETVPDHAAAVGSVLDDLERRGEPLPEAIGHRIVHGGAEHTAPARVDAALLESLRALVPFAPLHLPAEIRAVEAVLKRWPKRLQVACFDTAFHRTLSEGAQRGIGPCAPAVRDGASVDTTMGFSPAGGLVMGTRLGDVDPGLVVHWLGLGKGHDAKA